MTEVLGFDSRYWDGYLPEGTDYQFVGIKVSQGTNTGLDLSRPLKQWKRSNRVYGLLRLPFHYWIGPKWYQDPHSWGKAQAEFMFESLAEDFHGKYNGMGELPPALDLENKGAPKGRRSIQCIKACLNKMEQLFGRKPLIYSAGWWFDQWVKPYYSPDKFGGWDIYSYDLWEADPRPDTPIGEWGEGDIIQIELDANRPGFNAPIDINTTTQEWINSVIEVEKTYTQEQVDQMLEEQKEELNEACKIAVRGAKIEARKDALMDAKGAINDLMEE